MDANSYVESVLAKCAALKQSGIWAPEPHIRPEAWLNNFKNDPNGRLFAAIVLDNFIFYSDRASGRLLASAYHRIEDDAALGRIVNRSGDTISADSFWFVPVEGENPRPTDSGNTICKRLRDTVEIHDERFLTPAAALEKAIAGEPVVFVDDLIGSGQQLINTWVRQYGDSFPHSFSEAHTVTQFPAYCLAMFATQTALENISSASVPVSVIATHVIDETYSIAHLEPPSLVPPLTQFQSDLNAFLTQHAQMLSLKHYIHPLYGFHELGLMLAIQGAVPDCTIPLVWAEGQGTWTRLVRKNV